MELGSQNLLASSDPASPEGLSFPVRVSSAFLGYLLSFEQRETAPLLLVVSLTLS